MFYPKGFKESTVPIANVVEVEVADVSSSKGTDWLSVLVDSGFEIVTGSILRINYFFFIFPKVISAFKSYFLSWKVTVSTASDLKLPKKTPE